MGKLYRARHFLNFQVVLNSKYEGNSRFHIIVFDTSTTEIEYPINPTLHFDICSQDNDADEDQLKDPKREDIETTDDYVQIFDNHFSALPKPENKSSLQCPPPQKRMRAPTVSLSTSSSSSSSALEPEVVRSKCLSPSDTSNPLFIDISETETSCPVCIAKRNNVTSDQICELSQRKTSKHEGEGLGQDRENVVKIQPRLTFKEVLAHSSKLARHSPQSPLISAGNLLHECEQILATFTQGRSDRSRKTSLSSY
ncbi:hypothetical protein FNV43_RR17150 [Rhamnella rubrinervis]|uniref:Uncharacterized protein n=1 Tax=Rhamnella rubrinervis TaxID=2594499 RepID=A0A8K0DWZ8_9ROSA|nr:hypothetical protein FNV43_RR17150 [Rhamnella rubrinervis]